MDFLSSSLTRSSPFTTPAGQLVEQGTSSSLLGADWATNLQVSDLINASQENAEDALAAMRKQLRSDNPKVLQLTLTMLETCVKNTENPYFHGLVGNKDFLQDVAALSDGRRGWEVKEQALSLIQQWGLAFQAKQDSMPFFHECYMALRLRGVQFPPLEASSPIFTPPQSSPVPQDATTSPNSRASSATPASAVAGSAEGQRDAEFKKLEKDLGEVGVRVALCREMLSTSPGIEHDEALSEAVGFLEACRPRLTDIIEAGMAGVVTEGILELALQVNDDLLCVLEAERTGSFEKKAGDEVPAASSGAEGGGRPGGPTDDLLDFGDSKFTPAETATKPIPTHPLPAEPSRGEAPTASSSSAADPFDIFMGGGGGGGGAAAGTMAPPVSSSATTTTATAEVNQLLQQLNLEEKKP